MVAKGLKEHQAGETYRADERIRKAGGGRKKKTEEYPDLEKRVIEMAEADNGTCVSNGYKRRMFKKYLADFACETGMEVHISYYPSDTSKYNKIERRLFSQISMSMQGQPLTSMYVFQQFICHTTTTTGLTVDCVMDENIYEKGQKISDNILNTLPLSHKAVLGN